MITEVHIQNYRSIWDAKVKLSPFTLLIGANGAGKSNFLRLFDDLFNISEDGNPDGLFEKHLNHQTEPQKIAFIVEENDDSLDWEIIDGNLRSRFPCSIRFFSINPITIGNPESLAIDPVVNKDGAGAVQVLDALKTGDREDLFDTIEQAFQKYIPEVEKLSFVPRTGKKQLQVREKHFQKPILLKEVSEGTRFILTILTIIYQENPPDVICLEDIDQYIHPRLLRQLVELLDEITEDRNTQIIATTHNTHVVDVFKDNEYAVIIVEKTNGETQFVSFAERMNHFEIEDDDSLGGLWYAGFVGGYTYPERRNSR